VWRCSGDVTLRLPETASPLWRCSGDDLALIEALLETTRCFCIPYHLSKIFRSKFISAFFSYSNAHAKRGKLTKLRIYKTKVRSFPARFCAFPAPVQRQTGQTQRHSCTMAIGNAALGGWQREITELFRFEKPKLNEQSTHATGEPVPPTVPQSSIPTVTENDKIDDSAVAAGLDDTEAIILMSPVKSSQNQPSDTETNDSAIDESVVAAAGAPMAAGPPEAAIEGSMGDDIDDNTLPGSAVDNAAQAPTGQKGAATYKQWSLESKLYALDVLKRFNSRWSKAVNHLRDTQPSTYQHLFLPHLQHRKRLELEDKLAGGE
jgi:hypothetical protein